MELLGEFGSKNLVNKSLEVKGFNMMAITTDIFDGYFDALYFHYPFVFSHPIQT